MARAFRPRLRAVVVAAVAGGATLTGLGACAGVADPGPPGIRVPGVPEGWQGFAPPGYQVGLTNERHAGESALLMSGASVGRGSYTFTISEAIQAEAFRNARVRLSAWIKRRDIDGDHAGLWMRVDGPGKTLAFDNMSSRPLLGTADWERVSVVLDVGPTALGISFGAMLRAGGSLLVDDVRLEIVGPDVATTGTGNEEGPAGADSATIAEFYSRVPGEPLNLDFEGVAGPSASAVDWLEANTTTLSGTDPTLPLDDLEPLRAMIGSARIVGLGEGTHGTREFFLLKHRILRFLVERMGFTHFAIEATSPESDDMNRYVLTGEGDPATLLSRLYFWTWDTQEVFDMVQWMRQWNTTAAPDRRVRFVGFDMQSPGASMDSVSAFISRVDPSRSQFLFDRYKCLGAFRNHGATAAKTPASVYAARDPATKAACADGLREVHDLIATEAGYRAAEPDSYEAVLHHARLVQQFEAMISMETASASGAVRDAAMAENVGWIMDHAPAGARVALWAHNAHVSRTSDRMGGFLRTQYGSDYVPLGFLFGTGRFNALTNAGQLMALSTDFVPDNSLEALFLGTSRMLSLFDARRIETDGTAPTALKGAIPMRSIGAGYNHEWASQYFTYHLLPEDFDLLVYVKTTTETKLVIQ